MRTEFNVELWVSRMRAAIEARDAECLASLMQEDDGNGVFSYADSCLQFGETTREEWENSLIRYVADMLARIEI